MTMTPHYRRNTAPPAAGAIPWMINLAARLLARILNMPEPLVHPTGAFVFAQVQTFETNVGKTLCPTRLLRRLQAWLRQQAR
jgi:hypothetical protein